MVSYTAILINWEFLQKTVCCTASVSTKHLWCGSLHSSFSSDMAHLWCFCILCFLLAAVGLLSNDLARDQYVCDIHTKSLQHSSLLIADDCVKLPTYEVPATQFPLADERDKLSGTLTVPTVCTLLSQRTVQTKIKTCPTFIQDVTMRTIINNNTIIKLTHNKFYISIYITVLE